jgi:RNA polymerase II-associated protein 3
MLCTGLILKHQGNKAFRIADYETAVKQYAKAYEIEPELPHYQLNLAAAHLKLQK